jgi:pyridoxamine 5'-phosphate oxidase
MPEDPDHPRALPQHLDVAALRREYGLGELSEHEVHPDPIAQVSAWLAEAIAAGVPEPNAMTLATADADGAPSARTVLLRGLDERGFTWFTNRRSRKGRDLAANPRAALVLVWLPIERQVCVAGTVTEVGAAESDAYWAARPLGARVAAVASPQSTVVPDRAALDVAYERAAAQVVDGRITRPAHWGGYRLRPERVELWHGRRDRLHDRVQYRREGGAWVVERLAP